MFWCYSRIPFWAATLCVVNQLLSISHNCIMCVFMCSVPGWRVLLFLPAPRGRAGVGRQPTAGPGVVHPGRHCLPPWDTLPCLAPSSCRPPSEGIGLFEASSLETISLPALRDRQGLPANLGCRPQPFPLPGGQAFSRPSRRVEQWLALPASPLPFCGRLPAL